MEAIVQYKSADGRIFDTQDRCIAHECLVNEINTIMSVLPERKDLASNEYMQLDKVSCNRARRHLVEVAKRFYPPSEYKVFANDPDEIHPMSVAGRIICDSQGPLSSAWGRLMCINWDSYREYNQPFYALNEEKECGHFKEVF